MSLHIETQRLVCATDAVWRDRAWRWYNTRFGSPPSGIGFVLGGTMSAMIGDSPYTKVCDQLVTWSGSVGCSGASSSSSLRNLQTLVVYSHCVLK